MATTNWAGLANAALQKLTASNANAFKAEAAANALKTRNTTTNTENNKQSVLRSSLDANDRGMGRSGPEGVRRAAINTTFLNAQDLSRRNNLATVTAARNQKAAGQTAYKTEMARIKAAQAAASMSRIAQLPAGINFAALRAADPKYKK
jgi:hypothetical protein